MTQEERWKTRYEEVKNFIETNKRNPSKYRIEEHDFLNWLKANRKAFKPLPMMTAYKNLGFDIKDYPNAYRQFENEVTLPLHTRLTDEDVEYVIGNFCEIISK